MQLRGGGAGGPDFPGAMNYVNEGFVIEIRGGGGGGPDIPGANYKVRYY